MESFQVIPILMLLGLIAFIVLDQKKISDFKKEVNAIKYSDIPDEKKLSQILVMYANKDYTLISKTDSVMQLSKKKSFSLVFGLINILLIGFYFLGLLFLLIQILMYLSAKDKVITISL